ncbi:DNA methyltransferase [Novosphingobium sp. YJ-S2-02]|uniref:DNA methyltransferase n=1 Tax=Novosphingobium aureum TaxID=2792964 RepID=A0A931MLA5_9SPHN|nr:MT-A70 family methyltransferase [Novosphingobium aureum]MBH0113245.1 DNA methyltransferase [Novosphingobium aureum]
MTDTFSALKTGHYGVIEADPAWGWVSFSGKAAAPHRTAQAPYPVMTLDEMKAMPVADLAARDCLLNMWVIGSHLDQAIELGRHWGFTFKSDGFVWVKTGKHDPAKRPITMGKWVRKQVEYSLLFSRGKPSRTDAGVRQLIETGDNVIYEPRREHSRKPDSRYERLERLCAGPYLELFARTRRPGWDAWGNETDRFTPSEEFDSLLSGDAGRGEANDFDALLF